MLKTALRFIALTVAISGLGTTLVMGAANAQTLTGDVPLCSRTITDKCMTPSQAPGRHIAHTTHKAHPARHSPAAKTKTTTAG
ncbi:MAG: hypothetical protein ACOY5R_05765 [Pseudomonadota bacterium]|uniref:hypothetical protein n=1 Tax=Rhizorhabdus phycosphaerae TaxID=2711156 RepID=UPI0013EB4CDF|nr:hypothetical protein [Rhizorhabdus phycosphaerae]